MAQVPPGRTVLSKALALVSVRDGRPEVAGRSREWDEAIEQMRSRQLQGLGAFGQMTDAALGGSHASSTSRCSISIPRAT